MTMSTQHTASPVPATGAFPPVTSLLGIWITVGDPLHDHGTPFVSDVRDLGVSGDSSPVSQVTGLITTDPVSYLTGLITHETLIPDLAFTPLLSATISRPFLSDFISDQFPSFHLSYPGLH